MTNPGVGTAGPIERACAKCRKTKPAEEFYSEHWKRVVDQCASCRGKATGRAVNRRAALGAEGIRDMNLRAKYGISAEEYDGLREKQSYRCAICEMHEDEIIVVRSGRPRLDGKPQAEPFKLVVDHCHQTKVIRGLLCHHCNSAIGHLRESPAIIRAALAYVERAGRDC